MDDSEKLRLLVARPGVFHTRIRVFFDGSCSPNPGGTPQYGWYAMDDADSIIAQQSGSVDGGPRQAGQTTRLSGAGFMRHWSGGRPAGY